QALAVEKQLHLLAIAVTPDVNVLPFPAGPVPMWKQVQHGLIAPAGLIIVVGIFGETAKVHDGVLRTHCRPLKGNWLASIVKTRPHKSSCHPRSFGNLLPRGFGSLGPIRRIDVIGGQLATRWIALITLRVLDRKSVV